MKTFKNECKNILIYENVFNYFIDLELKNNNIETINKDNIVYDVAYKQGYLRGIRRILELINHEANYDE